MVKWQLSKQTAMAAIVVALSWFCYCAFASLSLRNYDNDPNMAKAMEYDLGENQHDYDKADRARAGISCSPERMFLWPWSLDYVYE